MFSIIRCWAPCFSLNNWIDLESGSILIALYTALVHVISMMYGFYILDGGRTDTFYSPLFEFGKTGARNIAIFVLIYSIFFIICCSIGLIYGIRRETRFYYLPWIWCSFLELMAIVGFGVFMVYRYWHYGWAIFAALTLWSYSGYHFYIFYVVISQYYILKELQEPTFIVMPYAYA